MNQAIYTFVMVFVKWPVIGYLADPNLQQENPGEAGVNAKPTRNWVSSVAPRFERKAAAEAEQRQVYYEGEICEAEELPNGFTKIREEDL